METEPELENALRNHLRNRAGSVDVAKDLRSGIDHRRRSIGRRRVLVRTAALALALLAGAGGASRLARSGDATPELAQSISAEWATAASGCEDSRVLGTESIVWLSASADRRDVETIGQVLRADSAVEGLRYIGEEETYDEFTNYFWDEPEILDLVEPDQLPTSFRFNVTSEDAIDALRNRLTAIASYDSLETAEQRCDS